MTMRTHNHALRLQYGAERRRNNAKESSGAIGVQMERLPEGQSDMILLPSVKKDQKRGGRCRSGQTRATKDGKRSSAWIYFKATPFRYWM
jgi:hypothetical protein